MSAHRPDYEQESHDEMVEQYAYQLENQHDSDAVQADHTDSYATPDPVSGPDGEEHVPDALQPSGPEKVLAEIETKSSIDDAHTESEWGAFAAWASESDDRTFVLAVHPMQRDAAQDRLDELDLEAEIDVIWS